LGHPPPVLASPSNCVDGVAREDRPPEGRSRSKTFDRKADAERFLISVAHSKLTGGHIDPTAGKVTFKSYAERWRLVRGIIDRFGERPSPMSVGRPLSHWVYRTVTAIASSATSLHHFSSGTRLGQGGPRAVGAFLGAHDPGYLLTPLARFRRLHPGGG